MGDSKFGWRYWLVQLLTCSRLLLGWSFVGIVVICLARFEMVPKLWFFVSLTVLILATATDLDGSLARFFKVCTKLGAFLDPLMDKCLYAATMILLPVFAILERDYLHFVVLVVLVILYLQRDHIVTTLRGMGSLYDMNAKAHWSGKVRSIFSYPMIWIIYCYFQAPSDFKWLRLPLPLVLTLESIGIVLTLLSIQQYTRRYQAAILLAGTKFD
jgi:phosphatidylglycerophosphate synthase